MYRAVRANAHASVVSKYHTCAVEFEMKTRGVMAECVIPKDRPPPQCAVRSRSSSMLWANPSSFFLAVVTRVPILWHSERLCGYLRVE